MYAECEQNDLAQNGALFNFDKSSNKIPHISFEFSEFINKSLAERAKSARLNNFLKKYLFEKILS